MSTANTPTIVPGTRIAAPEAPASCLYHARARDTTPMVDRLAPPRVVFRPRRRYDHHADMQRFSIARSLRLALVGLTIVLALVAAIGVSSLYSARQGYENLLI